MQDVNDQVDVLAQRVGVVRLGGFDRLDGARGDVAGAAPQRRPSVGVLRVARVEQDERPSGGRRELAELPLVGGVALLVDQQRRRAVREGACGEQPAGAGGLAGAGAAAYEHVAALAERQPGAVVAYGGHRHVLDVRGPGSLMDDLALRADPSPLAGGQLTGGLPQPATLELVSA